MLVIPVFSLFCHLKLIILFHHSIYKTVIRQYKFSCLIEAGKVTREDFYLDVVGITATVGAGKMEIICFR